MNLKMNILVFRFILFQILLKLVLSFQYHRSYRLPIQEYINHKNSKCSLKPPCKGSHKLFVSMSMPLLFDNQNPWVQYALIASSAGISLQFEKTKFGQLLSAPVCSMLLSVILTNLNILPSEGSIYIRSFVDMTVKLATPLLLLNADLKRIYKETGSSLLFAFLLGTIGTIIGSVISYSIFGASIKNIIITTDNIIKSTASTNDGWKLVSALTAKNIGGGLNYMGVANALELNPIAISLGLAVDNLMGLLYFPFISYLASFVKKIDHDNDDDDKLSSKIIIPSALTTTTKDGLAYQDSDDDKAVLNNDDKSNNDNDRNSNNNNRNNDNNSMATTTTTTTSSSSTSSFTMERLLTSLALGLVITASAEMLAPFLSLSPITISTVFTVTIATLFPTPLKSFIPVSDVIGKTLLMLFFAAIGNLSGLILPLLTNKTLIPLLLFNSLLYIIHLTIVFIFGLKIFKFPLIELIIASNANIGNAATASSLAVTKGWKKMIVPALLVGTLGNAIGTIVALFLGKTFFSKLY